MLETDPTIARYIEAKARLSSIRSVRVLRSGISGIPLADCAAELGIISLPPEQTQLPELKELTRVAPNLLLLSLHPDRRPLDPAQLAAAGFVSDEVKLPALNTTRPCWWRLTPA